MTQPPANIYRHGIVLALFAIATSGFSAWIYHITAPNIAKQTEIKQQQLLAQVLTGLNYDNLLTEECYLLNSSAANGSKNPYRIYPAKKDSQPVAVAIETQAPDGYSGAIRLLIGIDYSGNVLGVRVLEHRETPGLGDKIDIRISNWIDSFRGQQVKGIEDSRWAVKKDGGQFDQLTGATITARAVIRSVKQTVLDLLDADSKIETLPRCQEAK